MVTNFNRKDLVSFGNYLLSEKRKSRTSEINHGCVTHADVENWMHEASQNNFPVTLETLVSQVKSNGGRIVCTSQLSTLEIAEARACRRLWVDEDHYGLVYVPPKE